MCEKNIWIKNFQLYGKVNINPELFYGGIFKKVGLPMKAMELRWKHQCEKGFWLVIHFSRCRSPSIHKGQCCQEEECPLWRGSPAEHGAAEVQLGICPSGAPGWMLPWLVLPSGALERPRRSEQAQDCCPSSLLALRFHGRKLFY